MGATLVSMKARTFLRLPSQPPSEGAMFSECGTIHQPPAFVLVISLSAPGKVN